MKFTTTLVESKTAVWGYYLLVPEHLAKKLISKTGKRVLCSIDGAPPFPSGLMPEGDGMWFVNVNKKLRKQLGLTAGQKVEVELKPDESEYGLPMPRTLETALEMDDTTAAYFADLTPGKQRNLIYLVGQVKSEDIQIRRVWVILEHLKAQGGAIDFKKLNREIKEANEAARR